MTATSAEVPDPCAEAPSPPEPCPAPAPIGRGWWIALFLLLLVVAAIRARLLELPLERDEGEYAYAGQLLRQGVAPYAEAYNMKLPGVYVAYAAVMTLFGESIRGIHIGLLFLNAATSVLVFLLGRRLLSPHVGFAAAAGFSVLTLSPAALGLCAHAEHFVLPFATAGVLLLIGAIEKECRRALALSGFLFGVGVLMKQPGAAFLAAGGIALVIAEWRRPARSWKRIVGRAAIFGVAGVLPYLVTCAALAAAGVFDTFWFWTFTYARSYGGEVTGADAWAMFTHGTTKVLGKAVTLSALSLIGLSAPLWSRALRPHGVTVTLFGLFSFLAIVPGFFFREHYFLFLAPAMGLLAAVGLGALVEWGGRFVPQRSALLLGAAGVLALAVTEPVVRQRELLFELTPVAASRTTFGANPFPESIEIAKLVASITEEDERIAVLGSEPQIYFYANRRSATGYIYMYALMEVHENSSRMQREMVSEIEKWEPQVMVYVNVPTSWLGRPNSERILTDWIPRYLMRYDIAWLAELTFEGTRLRKGEQARAIAQDPDRYWIAVLRRKP